MRILIVEDEHRIAASIKKGLEQERFAVDVAYDGIEGFDLASSEQFDVILLDLMIPGMDGITMCRELRKLHNHTPILILTAKGLTEDKVTGLDSGADDYMTKPFSFEELLARIRALIRRPQKQQDDVLTVKDLSLNTKTFMVMRANKEVQLSGREFAILEYLMRHPHTICTKDDIIEHVWNYEADILPNTVEVYMKNVRKKVDVPFPTKKPLIQTVRGFGYKIG